jgi:hypothetical protein
MTQENLPELLRSLANGPCRQLVLATQHDLDSFEPKPDDCHGNAERWVVLHPQHKVVRGFLVMTNCVFNKHSVIDTGCSKLLDITPRSANESRNALSFIEFNGERATGFDTMPNQVIGLPAE